jgi:hypothetical protein
MKMAEDGLKDKFRLSFGYNNVQEVIKFENYKQKATAAGFEPAREDPNRFQVCRLNHSAMLSVMFEL